MELKAIQGPPVDWRARPMTEEKIIEGRSNLRPISFLEKGIQLAGAVAHITVPGEGSATGFMVDADVLMTNNHVFSSAEPAREAIIRFNFQTDLQGNLLATDEYRCDPDDFFWTSPRTDLDCTVVRVTGAPGLKWGFLSLPAEVDVASGDDVVIIQHPAGRPKEIALSDNEVAYRDDKVAQYITDTLPGSSGSPVFDDLWQLVALHHSGGWIPEPIDSATTYYRNEGILVSAIRAALPSWR